MLPGAWVDPGSMLDAVKGAGLTARADDVRVTAVGVVTAAGADLLLEVGGTKPPVVLALRADSSDGERASLKALREGARPAGARLEVEGFWRPWTPPAPAATAA